MTEEQKKKRKFRESKKWKLKRLKEKARADNKDEITQKPLRRGWQLHHVDLNEKNYEDMNKPFVCCNNLTHKFIHWLWLYYRTDETVIDRIKAVMEEMKEVNKNYIG